MTIDLITDDELLKEQYELLAVVFLCLSMLQFSTVITFMCMCLTCYFCYYFLTCTIKRLIIFKGQFMGVLFILQALKMAVDIVCLKNNIQIDIAKDCYNRPISSETRDSEFEYSNTTIKPTTLYKSKRYGLRNEYLNNIN